MSLTKDWQEQTKLFSFSLRFIFHEYTDLAILYLLSSYYRMKKRKEGFELKTLAPKLFYEILQKHDRHKLFDINNTIIINDSLLFKDEKFVKIVVKGINESFEKIVLAAGSTLCPPSHIFVSNVFMHNIGYSSSLKGFIRSIRASELQFATEVEISFLKCPSIDLPFLAIHALLKNFFAVPRLIYKDEIMEIDLKLYGKDFYYATNETDKIIDYNLSMYIKCNKIFKDGEAVCDACLCTYKETSIVQSSDKAGLLPSISGCCISIDDGIESKLSKIRPLGMNNYFNEFKKAVQPFLMRNKIQLSPVFLIEGSKGDGKEILLQELASYVGINHYRINNVDLTGNVYAQMETKLRNLIFNVKTGAPCLLAMHDFENFGRNNEGEYDERLIGNFEAELSVLFQNNAYPVIVFCCSNSRNIPAELRKLFLQIFNFEAPNEKERENILLWYLECNNFNWNFNIDDVVSQTNGFLYEDLKALIQDTYAEKMKKIKSCNEEITLEKEDIMKTLEHIHSSYNESIGAPKVPQVQWSDIGGLTDIKEEITKTINLPLKYPELVKVTGLKRSGILLFGPPGTGKTLLAKAIATECGLCFLSVKGPELLNKYVGQSEQNVREVFVKARHASPCIIFFDELDSLAPNRGRSGDSGGVMDRVVSQLLAEMDGLNEEKVVFVIGATNRPDLIDPALLRPGRFDKLLYVGPCADDDSKVSVLKALTRKFNLHRDVNFNELVRISPKNITGADYYGVCSNAWSAAVRRIISHIESDQLDPHTFSQNDVVVNMEDFEYAFKNTKPSISESDLIYFEKLKDELSSNK